MGCKCEVDFIKIDLNFVTILCWVNMETLVLYSINFQFGSHTEFMLWVEFQVRSSSILAPYSVEFTYGDVSFIFKSLPILSPHSLSLYSDLSFIFEPISILSTHSVKFMCWYYFFSSQLYHHTLVISFEVLLINDELWSCRTQQGVMLIGSITDSCDKLSPLSQAVANLIGIQGVVRNTTCSLQKIHFCIDAKYLFWRICSEHE